MINRTEIASSRKTFSTDTKRTRKTFDRYVYKQNPQTIDKSVRARNRTDSRHRITTNANNLRHQSECTERATTINAFNHRRLVFRDPARGTHIPAVEK